MRVEYNAIHFGLVMFSSSSIGSGRVWSTWVTSDMSVRLSQFGSVWSSWVTLVHVVSVISTWFSLV